MSFRSRVIRSVDTVSSLPDIRLLPTLCFLYNGELIGRILFCAEAVEQMSKHPRLQMMKRDVADGKTQGLAVRRLVA